MKKLSNLLNFIYSGDNHIVNTSGELLNRSFKNYDAECGDGFYFTKNFAMAEKYALKAVDDRGGTPFVNVFVLDKEKIAEDLSSAYFDSLQEKDTLEYLGANIIGLYPSFCRLTTSERNIIEKELSINLYHENYTIKPKDCCAICNTSLKCKCPASSDYIKAILLDNIDFNLSGVFIDYLNRKLNLKSASLLANKILDENNLAKFNMQIVLRNNILDIENENYLSYFTSVNIKERKK